jgi:hypothetical protein
LCFLFTCQHNNLVFTILQGGSYKSEILILFFKNDTSQLKTIRFYQIKTGWQSNILRIHSFNKTAILNLGPEPLAGLRHGVPGEGPHHFPDLRDLGLGLVVKLCSDPKFINAPHKISPQGCCKGSWEARSPSPTPP